VNYKILGRGNVIAYKAVFNKDININGTVTAGGNTSFNGVVTATNGVAAHGASFNRDVNGDITIGGEVSIGGNVTGSINGGAPPVPPF
jgi:hypothetical protein